MNIGIICKYPIPYGMAATTRIFSYSKGLLECGDKVDVWSIAPNNFNANNNNEGVFNGILIEKITNRVHKKRECENTPCH